MTTRRLFELQKIVEDAESSYGKERVYVISTVGYDLTTSPKGRNSKHDRRDWADKIFKYLYDMERNQIEKKSRSLSSGEYSFAYVKFAEDADGNVYGIVSGKSSFHKMYPSDVWFYDLLDENKKNAANFMRDNNLKWHTNKILVVLNENPKNHSEAYTTEKKLKQTYNLYD